MILVSFFLSEDALSDEAKRCDTLGLHGLEICNDDSAFWDTQYLLIKVNKRSKFQNT